MTTAQMSVYFFLQAAVILVVCRVVGWLAQRRWDRSSLGTLGLMLVGTADTLTHPVVEPAMR